MKNYSVRSDSLIAQALDKEGLSISVSAIDELSSKVQP